MSNHGIDITQILPSFRPHLYSLRRDIPCCLALGHRLMQLCCSIGSRGYFFYLLFQCFIVTAVDGVDPKPRVHTFQSTIIGGEGAYIPFPSHSILTYMGPKVWMLMLDCRYLCRVLTHLIYILIQIG